MTDGSTRATAVADALGLDYDVTRHGQVRSLEEAAAARGIRSAARTPGR
jgi:Cys-tRNA(Pro)/Cys-tRNA(Cys) deacylase